MLLSLTVYTGTAAVMAWLGWHVNKREQHHLTGNGVGLPLHSWEILATILVFVVVSSLRWLTSWDYNMYYTYYVGMQSLGEYSRQNFELGFALISMAMARAGLHFSLYFAFWAAVQIILILYALRHRKMLLPWLALCVFLGPYYIFWMGFVRQAIVEAIFLVMVEFSVRRKFWIFLLLSLIALSIHRMCIFFIPLYFIPHIKVRVTRQWIPIVLLVACVVLGSFPQWIKWTFDGIGRFADVLGYGHYYRLFMSDDVEYAFRAVYGPARLFPLLSCLIMVWYYPAIKRMFAYDSYLPALYRFSLLYMGYINLFANTTQYLTRPGELLRTVFVVMVCYTMCYLWRARKWVPLAFICFFNFYYVYYEIFKAFHSPSSIYVPELYHTFLF